MAEKEDRMLEALIRDRARQCIDRYMITATSFLDPHGRALAEKILKTGEAGSARFGFYGGYPDAERALAVFLPDYIEMSPYDYFRSEPDEELLSVLRTELSKGSPALTHRDYLGALMGLGIKRESTGDILVRNDGADIIVLKEMAEYIMMNMYKAGRSHIRFEEVPVSELIVPEQHRVEMTESVSSLRLDNMISAVFGLSRGRAAEAISAGIVFVNGAAASKPEKKVAEGDKLVLRGRGKAVFSEIKGTSSKGRTIVVIEKYK